jgi:hypothetical protein
MALSDLVLSTLTFAQNWEGASVSFNLLLLPAADPTVKLTTNGPPFAGTTYALEAVLIPGSDPPSDSAPGAKPFSVTTPAPASSVPLFTKLATKYAPKALPLKSLTGVQIKKALPESYTSAFPYAPNGNPFTVVDDFGCSLRSQTPVPKDDVPPPTKDVSWGSIISLALRQPALGQALGLVYTGLTITPSKADLTSGAWLYVRFVAATNPYATDLAANPDLIKYFAARLPILAPARSLFTPVLYPVDGADSIPSVFDQANLETQAYDDGFAKIVHCHQPTSADVATEENTELTTASDAGVQLGWDDEQVAIWMNRQLEAARGADPTGLPLGVLGYRVDARVKGAATWQSLCVAQAQINFDPSIDGIVSIEPPVEPSPARPITMTTGDIWLPRYFAQWRGPSLVVADPVPLQLSGGTPPASLLQSLVPPGLLRYGNTYEFRVRLADLTHGGPAFGDKALNPAPAAIGTSKFQRWIRPRAARTDVVTDPANSGRVTQITAFRPLLGYPEFLLAGVDPSVVPTLIGEVPAAIASHAVLGANDPDVDTLRIIVEALAPTNDDTDANQLDGRYREIYHLDVAFPPLPANAVPQRPPNPAEGIVITPVYQDVANIAKDLTPPAPANPLMLPVPRARDVRIRVLPIANSSNPDYFGSADIQRGIESHFDTRDDTGVETKLFRAAQDFEVLKAVFLQPGGDIVQRLAAALELDANGLTLAGRPGQRVCFGASGGLRHTLSGNHGQITFATESDLLDHWIVAITPVLNRDWTWDSLANASVQVSRDGKPTGTIEFRQVVDSLMTAEPLDPTTQRDSTQLIFFDTVDPHPDPASANPFPVALSTVYTITPQLVPGATLGDAPRTIQVVLPKAVAPAQTPVLASAGIALSTYDPAPDYSSTALRRKRLWIEFEEPLRDSADRYFVRVLASGADPLLVEGRSAGQQADTVDIPEPPLKIDPEPIRIITPGQLPDPAGLDAMQLTAPDSEPNPRRFLLPLPAGLTEDSLELFGFFTYEIRVGHAGSGTANWSTAQARFGRPLRVTGVQHPAPPLKCMVNRQPDAVVAVAPFASPVRNGLARAFGDTPKTSMWALLYAQVMQADGASHRNILLGARPFNAPPSGGNVTPPVFSRDIYGFARFTQKDDPSQLGTQPPRGQGIDTLLAGLGLPDDSSLSVLAVEMMPQYSDIANNPVDADFGKVRILRTSPLVAVPSICSVPSKLDVAPLSLLIGARIGDTDSQTVTLTNSGSISVLINKISLGGTFAGDYSVSGPCNPAGAIPTALPPGSNCALDVLFSPGGIGLRPASLTIVHDSGTVVVGLTGRGLKPLPGPTQ